jgi:pyruvate/oxaloacetate carboxyltransferase
VKLFLCCTMVVNVTLVNMDPFHVFETLFCVRNLKSSMGLDDQHEVQPFLHNINYDSSPAHLE